MIASIGGLEWEYRPETNDLGIIDQVFIRNNSSFPNDMTDWNVIDVGAHIGAASLLAASRGAKVLAYEPGVSNFQYLLANIKRNGLQVRPFNLGIGEPGSRKLYLDNYNNGQNSGFLIYPELSKEVYELMEVVSLDHPFSLIDSCDLLKLDCEGCEDVVLEQLLGGLYTKVSRLYVEFHTNKKKHNLEMIKSFYSVKDLGYGFWLERQS